MPRGIKKSSTIAVRTTEPIAAPTSQPATQLTTKGLLDQVDAQVRKLLMHTRKQQMLLNDILLLAEQGDLAAIKRMVDSIQELSRETIVFNE